MDQLRTAAPGLLGNMGVPPPPAGFTTTSNSSTTNSTTTTSNTTTNTNTTSSTTPSAQANPALFSEFMARMVNGMATGANQNLPPEQRYSTQLDTLASMGFVNREANLQGKLKDKQPTANSIFCFLFNILNLLNFPFYFHRFSSDRYIRGYKCCC